MLANVHGEIQAGQEHIHTVNFKVSVNWLRVLIIRYIVELFIGKKKYKKIRKEKCNPNDLTRFTE